ncbi:hypothetical protein QBC37DRAFT_388047 [Rhypophila decipiens]|uniref:Uncharacterized protein n=1 Tax=Rhypophila decipiens TaxID=261697 RepID=A0AAN6Y737_9PEZI|nr:hypothetical protein QBC37DRAFT_388047 [Rhypophila decipiens]
MDPLSISASAIAVAGVAARLCSLLADIRDAYISLPDRLHALNEEVRDLRVVLNHLAACIKDREEHGIRSDLESGIPRLLSQGKEHLVTLEELLWRFRAPSQKKRELVIKSLLWRKSQSRLVLLQADIKQVKSSLSLLLGASNSHDMMHMRLDFQQAIFTNSSNSNICEDDEPTPNSALLLAKMFDHHTNVEERLSRVESLLLSQAAQLQTTQTYMMGSLYDASRPSMRTRPVRSISPTSEKMIRSNAHEPSRAVGFCLRGPYYAQQGCTPGCSCSCHSPKSTASPSFFKEALGQLFIGYVGISSFGHDKCNDPACHKPQVASLNVEYWFPLGFFWSQIIRLRLAYEASVGPSLQLSTLRHVPDTATCVTFAFTGNVQGLKALFSQGLASPRDVSSSRGYSLLRWALYGQQYEMCKFLMASGADPSYCPKAWTDDCPREKAFDTFLRGGLQPEAMDILRVVAQGCDYDEYIEKQNFSRLHKIVIGLCPGNLAKELALPGIEVDVCDVTGRTPLDWAAARGDETAVATLLSFGADPNHTDKRLGTPLCLAANQGQTVCARLLLEAGAFPNPPLPKGIKTGNPLNCAARNATDPVLLKTLLDFGADIESTGLDGMTPLLGVARGNSAAHAAVLLDYGANIHAVSRSGKTPLTAAIEYNNYGVLRLLLAKWFGYAPDTNSSPWPTAKATDGDINVKALLEIVARYADIKTIGILLADSSVSLRAILSSVSHRPTADLKIAIAPGLDHFKNMLAARAAEFTDASKSTALSGNGHNYQAPPSLEELTTQFETLLTNLTNLEPPPSYQGEREKDPRGHISIESKMESGLLGRGQDDDDDDVLLVFEDAQEHLVNIA